MDMGVGKAADGTASGSASFEFEAVGTGTDGTAVKLSLDISMKGEGKTCPDADGNIPFKLDFSGGVHGSAGTKQGGFKLDLKASGVAHVNDSAYIDKLDLDANIQHSIQRPPPGHNAFYDMSIRSIGDGAWMGPGSNIQWSNETTVNRVGSTTKASDVDAQNARRVLQMTDSYLLTLQELWRNGACVEVLADEPGTVAQNSSTSVQAKVRHRLERTELHLPIESSLAGPASLTPVRVEAAPGNFTYVAPGVADNVSTLTFTSTSRRGIGKVSVAARTEGQKKAYRAAGGQNIAISGTICGGLSSPFTLSGSPPDGSNVTFSYNPSGDQSGSYTYTGGAGRVVFSGNGAYTIGAGSGDTLILKQSDSGCVTNIPGGTCASYTNEVTLTPMEPCN